jgi:hypothetical protein
MLERLVRPAPWVVLTGNVALLLGLTWDAALHAADPGLAAREDVLSLTNPGHFLFGTGLGLVTFGMVLFLVGRMARPGLSRLRRAAFALPVAGMILLSLAGLAAAATQSALSASHDHDHGHDHAAAPPVPPTAAEQAAADQLAADTRAGIARFADVAVAEAASYVELNPRVSSLAGRSHYVNRAYLIDGARLDPTRPEGLVYLHGERGERILLGALYIARPGMGPDVGGPLTEWHTHDNLCSGGFGVAPKLPLGLCPPGTVAITAEMMHVWIFDHPQGPFADHLDRAAIETARAQLAATPSDAI